MGVNSDPDQGQEAEVLTAGSHVQLSITILLLVYLLELKHDLQIIQHMCLCVLTS
jgi:hypothetical protein